MNQNQYCNLILDHTKDQIWMIDNNHNLIYANQAYLKLMKEVTGVEIDLNELVVADGLREGDIEKWKTHYNRALQDEYFEIEEHFYNQETKEIQYSQITFTPILNENCNTLSVACHSRDITRIVKQKSETNQLMDASLDVFCTLNEEGKFVFVNAAAKIQWGYSPDELRGKLVWDFILNEDLHKTKEANDLIINGLEVKNFGNRFRKKDGSIAYNLWSARWDNLSKLMYCVAKDVKEKIEQEEIINKNKERFKALVQEGSDLIAILDPEGQYVYVSPTSTSVLGIAPEEFVGRNAFEFIHPEDIKSTVADLEKIGNQSWVLLEPYRFQNRNKEWRWMETILTNMLDNPAINGIVANSRDITVKIEERHKLKLFEKLINSTTDAIIIAEAGPIDGTDPRTIYINEAFTKMTGYTADEVLGKNPWLLLGLNSNKENLKNISEKLNHWESIESTVFRHTKSGKGFWVNFSMSPVADSTGTFTHWISVQRDVTEQKNEELKKDLLADIVKLFSVENRFKSSLDKMNQYLINYGGFDLGEIWMINSEKSRLNLISQIGESSEGKNFINLSQGKSIFQKSESLSGQVWTKEECIILENLDTNESFVRYKEAAEAGIKAGLGIPLIFNDQLIGVLSFMVSEDVSKLHSFRDFFGSLGSVLAAEIHRKKIEDELTQIFETAPDIICLIGFDGKFKKMNSAGIKLLGYKEEEIFTQHSSYFVCPEDRDHTNKALEQLAIGQTAFHFTSRCCTKSGERIWLDWSCSSVVEEELIYAVAKNITEEKDLQELLDSANNMARIGGWEYDAIKNSLYWSPITRSIHEVGEDFEVDVSTAMSFFKDESELIISDLFKGCLEFGKSFDREFPVVTAKGKDIWVRIIGQSEFRNGKSIRVFGSIQDISPLKITQLELIRAFKEKNTILESITDGFFSVDKNWIVTYWNKAAEKILGIPKGNILGKEFKEVYNPETNGVSYLQYYKAIQDQKPVHFEVFFDPLDSWFEISAYPSEIGLSVYFKDITLRKTTDELIRQSNERFEKVTQATHDAIWDWDLENNLLFWGEGYKTLFGIDLDQTTPSHENWQKNIHPEDLDRVLNSVNAAISNKEVSNLYNEYRYKKADGEYAFIIDRGLIIRDSNGKANRIVGAISDITERKEFEASMKDLNERLESRARELAMSNSELENFAYVASHDLQEPLRMVTGFLTQLERKYKDQLDDKAQQYIHFAVDGAKRMRQVILDLLEYSRVGRFSDDPEDFSIQGIIEEVRVLQRKLIEKKKAKINCLDLPVIRSFRVPVFQIFQNLINNSLKYSKENTPVEITVTSKDLENHWEFTVADNGIGLNKENFEKIFIIFQRLHPKDEFEGNGIGLAIVKKIVENLGGKIWIDSEAGIGTSFHFTVKKGIQLA